MEKFADEAFIEVSSGKGGNGCVAFRREKFVPRGGPSGGDGGRGGDVVFVVRRNLRTLSHLRHKHSFTAENGRDGEGRERSGKDGEDVVIPLPPGTVIRDADTGRLVRDFGLAGGGNPGAAGPVPPAAVTAGLPEGERFVFLKGGRGGWGNVHFKSPVNRSPRRALPGKPGEFRRLRAELRIMADIGLVGFPNAGKSSLLDKFTNARPKIAPYPFTTKIPNLGVLTLDAGRNGWDSRDIVIADIPGLIEGACEGAGLGIRFLKHVSRAAALVFLVDLSEANFSDAFTILYRELENFSPELVKKRRIICGSKLDLEGAGAALERLRAGHPDETVLGISVFSGAGLKELAGEISVLVDQAAQDAANGDTAWNMWDTPEEGAADEDAANRDAADGTAVNAPDGTAVNAPGGEKP
ncbi:MAG: GTPase ObgE [Treponema sp.]|jgi:GTP-binding protein|nr:GTPase ObgE [Treponema sp.]